MTRRLLAMLGLASAACVVLAAAALAATITGTDGPDRLIGSPDADQISGLGGRDLIKARPGDDTVNGGPGRDLIRGNLGNDVIDGGPGADRVFANQGVDKVTGGDGRDDLWALSRKDVTAQGDPAGDTLDGGAGGDLFHTYDGEVDRITCGDGRDKVIADVYDAIADATPENPNGSCERVVRDQPESDVQEGETENPGADGQEGL